MKKIVFVAKHDRSFVDNDYNILSKHYDVTRNVTKESIHDCDVVYCWFASGHALKPLYYSRKYNKRFIVVTGGYDVAFYKGVNGYGLPVSLTWRWIPRYILDRSDVILAVSEFNMCEVKKITDNSNIFLVNNSIKLKNKYGSRKDNIVLSVGFIDKVSYHRKGLDRFIDLAAMLPNYRFYHIGSIDDNVTISHAPSNMNFCGYVDDIEEWFNRARVYCQLSRYESFGLSVVEAMDHGCIPIVWDSGALMEIVNGCGQVVTDLNMARRYIIDIMMDKKIDIARWYTQEWLSQFDNSLREKKLINIIEYGKL